MKVIDNCSGGGKAIVLAVETSGREGSVAIARGGELLAWKGFSAPLRHSAELFPAICGLLAGFDKKARQIEHVYISVGPGSFTGLRIAVTLAKMMHLANGSKVVSVDTLDVIAANATDFIKEHSGRISRIAAILDAKRGQFFVAVYENSQGRLRKICRDCVMTSVQFIERFADTSEPVWLLGEGLVYYKDKFSAEGTRFFDRKFWYPTAAKVHLLGRQMALKGKYTAALSLVPNYLSRPDVKLKH